MTSIVQPTASSSSNWEDLNLSAQPSPDQLDNIKAQLDLILLALEAIANLSSEAMLQAASELNLESMSLSGGYGNPALCGKGKADAKSSMSMKPVPSL
jgi:hypothetical protein